MAPSRIRTIRDGAVNPSPEDRMRRDEDATALWPSIDFQSHAVTTPEPARAPSLIDPLETSSSPDRRITEMIPETQPISPLSEETKSSNPQATPEQVENSLANVHGTQLLAPYTSYNRKRRRSE
jgi:hypothetical protein